MKSKVVILLVMFCTVSIMTFAQKRNFKEETKENQVALTCYVNQKKHSKYDDKIDSKYKDPFFEELSKGMKARESGPKLTDADRQLLVSLSLEYEKSNMSK